MLVILVWFVLFVLGTNFMFAEGLTLLPDFLIGKFSRLFGWVCLWAIAAFVVWCFAED